MRVSGHDEGDDNGAIAMESPYASKQNVGPSSRGVAEMSHHLQQRNTSYNSVIEAGIACNIADCGCECLLLTGQTSKNFTLYFAQVFVSSRAAMKHFKCALSLKMLLLSILYPAAHATGATTLLQGNSNSHCTATNAAASAAS